MSDADKKSRRILAVIDAAACGFVHSESASTSSSFEYSFLATKSFAMLQDSFGCVVKKLRWPADARAKLSMNLQVSCSNCLTFVCSSRAQMTFTLCAGGGRSVQVEAGFVSDRDSCVKQRTATAQLSLSESLRTDTEVIQWKSDTARRLLAKAKMQKKQQLQQKRMQEKHHSELSASAAASARSSSASTLGQVADAWSGGAELEAAKAQIKSLCDAWLQHCRSAVGLQLQLRQQPPLSASAASGSLKLQRGQQQQQQQQLSRSVDSVDAWRRLPSAPATCGRGAVEAPTQTPAHTGGSSSSSSCSCPVLLRRQLLMQGDAAAEAKRCRCNYWLHPPVVTDLELDLLVQQQQQLQQQVGRSVRDSQQQQQQLIVVAITDSSQSNDLELAQLCRQYATACRQRHGSSTAPCVSAASDNYRLLLYDLLSACDNTNSSIPLLLLRHNVRPGDCVIYAAANRKILFAGRRPQPEQLRRQLAECRRLADRGCSGLPGDFRLQRPEVVGVGALLPAAASRVSSTMEPVPLRQQANGAREQVELPRIH